MLCCSSFSDIQVFIGIKRGIVSHTMGPNSAHAFFEYPISGYQGWSIAYLPMMQGRMKAASLLHGVPNAGGLLCLRILV